MQKYKGLRNIILEILDDHNCWTTEQLVSECEKRGMIFENGKNSIYNITYQLKKNGDIERVSQGVFRRKKMEEIKEEQSEETSKMQEAVWTIEKELEKYKDFDWINCSDDVLKQARMDVKELLKIAEKIQKSLLK